MREDKALQEVIWAVAVKHKDLTCTYCMFSLGAGLGWAGHSLQSLPSPAGLTQPVYQSSYQTELGNLVSLVTR